MKSAEREATGTLSSDALRVLALGGAMRGVNVCERFAIDPALLVDPDARVDVSIVVRIWDELPSLVGDADTFGLHLAELAVAAPLGLGGQLIVSAPTLGDGIRRILAFERVFHDVRQSELTIVDGKAILRHDPDGLRMPRHAIEFAWAWVVLLARRVTGSSLSPRSLAFAHPAPASRAEHLRLLGTTPLFDADVAELVFDARDLERPSRGVDPALGAILESHAKLLRARLPGESFVERVRAAIHAAMLDGDPGIDEVARRLDTSSRTLQRKLKDDGTSHQEQLDAVRTEAARSWLADPSISIAEIAFGLGFAEVSAFHRAFVRWTGSTPGQFRKSLAP